MQLSKLFSPMALVVMIFFIVAGFLAVTAQETPKDVGFEGQKEMNKDFPDAPWITHWYSFGPITENGGHPKGSGVEWIKEGTGGKLTDVKVSTFEGLKEAKNTVVKLPKNGGNFEFSVTEIDPADGNNQGHQFPSGKGKDLNNIDSYHILVIGSPKAQTLTGYPAHDDHAQIWLNGTKIYGNAKWTGKATTVDYTFKAPFKEGTNVLLFRISEGGGSDYLNLHFQDQDSLRILPTKSGRFWESIQGGVAVDSKDKIASTWADIKRRKSLR